MYDVPTRVMIRVVFTSGTLHVLIINLINKRRFTHVQRLERDTRIINKRNYYTYLHNMSQSVCGITNAKCGTLYCQKMFTLKLYLLFSFSRNRS